MAADIYTVIKTTADLLDTPNSGSNIEGGDSQLLFGEDFKAKNKDNGWIPGTSLIDGYQGYIRQEDLQEKAGEPTHIVKALLTHIYKTPDFKTRPVMALGFMSRLDIDDELRQDGFVKLKGLGWIFEDHLKSIDEPNDEINIAATALQFLGTPYLYGGRSALGIDCSALVQLALAYHGIPCPRDSDQQMSIGTSINENQLQRDDIVFFKAHVGIMTDSKNILNATARSMDVRIEKLDYVAAQYDGILSTIRI